MNDVRCPHRVIPALVAGIHVFLLSSRSKDVDGRVKPGHDGKNTRAVARMKRSEIRGQSA